MATRSDDDATLSGHSSTLMLGRMRAPTEAELAAQDSFFRPDAVLGMRGPAPLDASPFELHVAGLVDGVRPVARIKKKSGLSSSDLRIALGMLRDRNLLRLVGIIEEAAGPWEAEIRDHAAEIAAALASDPDVTKPAGSGDIVPHHVMAEIKSMLADDDEE
jgi:hypothetical protein